MARILIFRAACKRKLAMKKDGEKTYFRCDELHETTF